MAEDWSDFVMLSENGRDTVDNAIGACPNRHRRLHHGQDRQAYREGFGTRCAFLKRPGPRADAA